MSDRREDAERGRELAPWAQRDADSCGRAHAESEHPYRAPYARDRDRIIHCRAFRRLEYKTQVFVNHEGDHYRTRLTHSIEVSQIARTVCRALRLNEDLAETLALCHDIGHAPFGHLGEDVLDPLLSQFGGFDHNRQALRIVDVLERRYPGFNGLNLTWEVREGIVKHSGPPDLDRIPEAVNFAASAPPPLEAQLIDLVDEVAYNHHDLEDGLESKLIEAEDLAREVPLFGRHFVGARREHVGSDPWLLIKVALRRLIDELVTDLITTTGSAAEESGARSVDEIRSLDGWLASLSDSVARENRELKSYLRNRLYRHPRMSETREFFAKVLEELFGAFVAEPSELPERFFGSGSAEDVARGTCDYVSGMTDRFALQEHRRLCSGPGPESVPVATR